LCAILAREAEPSGGPNPARALDRGAGRFLLDLIDGSERWGGAGAAAVAAALELGGRLRQQADRVFAVCALQDFEWRDGALYPLAGRRLRTRSRSAFSWPTGRWRARLNLLKKGTLSHAVSTAAA